ncbi:MAG: type III effector [Methylococcaceae bacterium]|nr:type III effector [Methylococcaceae bacterium]
MTLETFINHIKNNQTVKFDETMSVIADNYHYQATEFSNGLGDDKVVNQAGTNEGSCKTFAFAQQQQLNPAQTLSLFGEHYQSVLDEPAGSSHQNIRNFMKYGWKGIVFQKEVLTEK